MLTFNQYCYLAIGAIFCAAAFVLCGFPMLGILQQSGYSGKQFLRWYCRRGNMLKRRYSLLAISLLLLTALFSVCFSFAGARLANLISAVPFLGVSALFFYSSRRALKVPVRRTGRSVRLTVCYFILLVLLIFGLAVGFAFAAEAVGSDLARLLRYLPLVLIPLLFPFLLAFSNLLAKVYEVPRNRRYVRRAAAVLEKSGCVKVGVTGSFGKTSVKTFAAAILSEKYRVIATPSSYNTPMGIAKTVFEAGTDCDIFLAEMGARKTGDIAELCDMVKPKYGIVTGICPQHIETFGSLEAVKAEKGTLARYAEVCVLGESAVGFAARKAVAEGRDFAAENIVCTAGGTKFTLRLGEESIPVETNLLGRHAAQDIALAAALCVVLGMSTEEIVRGIRRVEPVRHRLEPIQANGIHILDDSYNGNIEGAKNAVETLRLFGGRKYVVTPGLVELGELEETENRALGASLVGLEVVLVGETLVLSVRNGYLDAGGDAARLRVVPTLAKAQEILKEELSAGDSVLFLNDLPDIYR